MVINEDIFSSSQIHEINHLNKQIVQGLNTASKMLTPGHMG